MRKYFLLSAVALLTATNANATTDYAEVTAKATIEVANQMECSDWDLGTIVIKSNNPTTTITTDTITLDYDSDIILSISNGTNSYSLVCYVSDYTGNYSNITVGVPNAIKLTGKTNGDQIIINNITSDAHDDASGGIELAINGTFNIPASVKADDYESVFTVNMVY